MKRANNEGSIYYDRRGKIWIAAVTCGHSKETGRAIRRTRHARTKQAAVDALRDLRQMYLFDTAADGASTKLIDYIRTYYEVFRKPNIRESTQIAMESVIRAAGRLPIASRALSSLKPTDIQAALGEVASAHTKRQVFTLARAALRQAVNDGVLARNPMAGLPMPKTPARREIAIITPEEAGRLVRAAEADPVLAIGIKLMYLTGMRPEEALALTWGHIDPKAGIIRIRQAVTRMAKGVAIGETKTAGSKRDIEIPKSLSRALDAYRRWQLEYIMSRRDRYEDNGLLVTWDGKPLLTMIYARRFRRAAEAAGVAITPKGLRHSHATQLFAAGWNAKDVQRRLGHSSIRMTMDIYTHYIPERGNGIADYLETLCPYLV